MSGRNAAPYREGPQWGLILDAAPILVSVHDADYRIIKVNATFKEFLHRGSKEVIGRRCYEVVHGTSQPPAFCPHSRALKTGTCQEEEFFEPRLGIRLLVSVYPIFDAKGKLIGSLHLAKEAKTPVLSSGVTTNDLTDRQKNILKLLCRGRKNGEIADQLKISPRTVEYHRRQMMKKFSARSLAELVARVLTQGAASIE
jgi:DNA-binding CsgD family transcriptional regulator